MAVDDGRLGPGIAQRPEHRGGLRDREGQVEPDHRAHPTPPIPTTQGGAGQRVAAVAEQRHYARLGHHVTGPHPPPPPAGVTAGGSAVIATVPAVVVGRGPVVAAGSLVSAVRGLETDRWDRTQVGQPGPEPPPGRGAGGLVVGHQRLGPAQAGVPGRDLSGQVGIPVNGEELVQPHHPSPPPFPVPVAPQERVCRTRRNPAHDPPGRAPSRAGRQHQPLHVWVREHDQRGRPRLSVSGNSLLPTGVRQDGEDATGRADNPTRDRRARHAPPPRPTRTAHGSPRPTPPRTTARTTGSTTGAHPSPLASAPSPTGVRQQARRCVPAGNPHPGYGPHGPCAGA